MARHHIRPGMTPEPEGDAAPEALVRVTPASAEWRYLGFEAAFLATGETRVVETGGREHAFVPLRGTVDLVTSHGGRSGGKAPGGDAPNEGASGETFRVTRKSVFADAPHILYAPPGTTVTVRAVTDAEVAWGSAPAEGRYPLRLFRPEEMKREVRGGGPATRQVNHVLAPPLPAERLILFEVYVPGGAWSGWPPHCHDGRLGSAYLEETYYYRIEPEEGFALHRNYLRDEDVDELFTVKDGDLVLVAQGFHPVAAAPGSSVYFLNFLAGELVGEERSTPPVDDPDHAWIKDDWHAGELSLPVAFDNVE